MAILQFLGSLAFLGLGALLLGLAGVAGPFAILLLAFGAVLLIVGLIGFVIGWGLWTLKPWARTLAMIFAVIGLILYIGSLVLGSFGSIVGVIIEFIIIYYLTRPGVKAAFGVGPMPSPMGQPYGAAMGPPPGTATSPAGSTGYCSQCGAPLTPGATTCASCGAPVR